MLTPQRLLLQRVRSEIRFQYKAWRMAIDWTVALYIVIPAMAAAAYQVYTWWLAPPFWLSLIPYTLVKGYLYLLALSGTIRLYIQEADQLFLYQRKEWLNKLMAGGMGFSLGLQALKLIALLGVLAPLFLYGYGLDEWSLVRLGMAVAVCKGYALLFKPWFEMRYSGWRAFLYRIPFLSLGGILFTGLIMAAEKNGLLFLVVFVVLAIPLYRLYPSRLHWRGSFLHDVKREEREKMKVVRMLVGDFIKKKPRFNRKKPILFPRSGKLFPSGRQEYALAEAVVKSVFRNSSKMGVYGYAMMAYSVALVLVPQGEIRTLAWAVMALLLSYMAKIFAKDILLEPLFSLFHWNDGTRYSSLWIACTSVMLPGYLILALLVGLLGPWGWPMLVYLPAGVILGIFSSRLVTLWGV